MDNLTAQPLSGLRVIEMGQLVAGPFCGQMLADFGAEVIKVEPPEGDPMRRWGQVRHDGQTLWWPVIARNKKSVAIDVRTPAGQQLIRDLAAGADILIENFRPGTMERWGLGYETLAQINPRLIMVRISGYGQTGPYAPLPGYASIGEAVGGLRHVIGYPDRPSCRAGVSLGDSVTGLMAANGALLALQARERSGTGQMVDAAIYESVLALMESLVPEFVHAGYERQRTGAVLPRIAPTNAYPTRDGEMLVAANQDTIFARLAKAMGQPDLAQDPRFATHEARADHQEMLDQLIADWTIDQDSPALKQVLDAAAVPNGKAYTAADMIDDPHFKARGAIVSVPDPRFGTFAMHGVFPRLSATPGRVSSTGPELGAHTDQVLGSLAGYTAARLATLRVENVIA